MSDPDHSPLFDIGIERKPAAESPADVFQHFRIALERVRIDRRHRTTPAQSNEADRDSADAQQRTFPLAFGKSIDAVVAKSNVASTVAEDYLNGNRSLPADVKDVLTRPAVSTENVKDISVAAVLAKIAGTSSALDAKKIEALLEKAKELGLK